MQDATDNQAGQVLGPGESRRYSSALPPDEVLGALRARSKKGKLPGYEEDGSVFRVAVFGAPFDRELVGDVAEADGGSTIDLRSRLKLAWPIGVVAAVAFSLWPGWWMTDVMLDGWGWYAANVSTWWWYLPSWVLMVLGFWGVYRKSEAATAMEAGRVASKVAALAEAVADGA